MTWAVRSRREKGKTGGIEIVATKAAAFVAFFTGNRPVRGGA